MRTQANVQQDIQRVITIKAQYQSQLTQLESIQKEDSVEVARLISATARGIRRLEKRHKDLNKEMDQILERE
jgi:hypothetical protein